ncbi:uncharacterized protein V1513DRAFT_217998 [Lipomyces chichibuensis]|uniref:uncharacterized protein n=1 Tax=Lipomyces chichibuensis TaxID=1546026 RepID=UPI0033441FEA
MEHGVHPSAVNKNGHYLCQQESHRKTYNQFYPQTPPLPLLLQPQFLQPLKSIQFEEQISFQPYQSLSQYQPMSFRHELQQQIEQQSRTPPQTQFSAAEHIYMPAQSSTINPPYSYSSAHSSAHSSAYSSVVSSPLSSSPSELWSPLDIDFDTFGLLDVDADMASMNCDIALGMCRTNSDGMESNGLGFQLVDECGHTPLDIPVDPQVSSSATPVAFMNNSTLYALTPMAAAPISTATPHPPMMAPGCDANVFLFAGEHEPNPHSEEFMLHRTSSSDASTIIQDSATIAPSLLSSSSSSSSTSTMYSPADETEITLLPSEEAVPTSFTSLASMATADAVASIVSTESRVSATDEEFCEFEEYKRSRSILDMVENEKGRAAQEQLVLTRQCYTSPPDVLQSCTERIQSSDATPDESDRTSPVVCEKAVQPILIERTQSPAKTSNFAVVLPTTTPEKAKPMIARFRPCESAYTNSMPAIRPQKRRSSSRKLQTPPSSKLTAAKTNTACSEPFDGSTSRSPAPKRKLSDAGLDERSDLVREPVVKYAAVDGPASSRPQKPTCSFAIVIKTQGTDNTKTQRDSPWRQLHLQDPNKRQKLFASLALAVGILAVAKILDCHSLRLSDFHI